MPSPSHRIRRLLPAALVGVAASIALTGCQPGAFAPSPSASAEPGDRATATPSAPAATPDASPSARASASPGSSAAPSGAPGAAPRQTPAAAPTRTPSPTGTALPTTPPLAGDIACSEIYTAEQLYDFNPNFAPNPTPGALPAALTDLADAGGTVCAYQHVTGGDRLMVGVLPDAAGFSAPEFVSEGELGVAVAPTGGTVVVVASEYFGSAADAQPVLEQVVANVG